MKLRRNKKGFTIIELVIVIAVIGILAAVLIPTFVNLTNKANEASDNALVNNLNKALKMEEQEPGHKKAETLEDAILDLENQGYLLENLASKSGKDLLWSQSQNQFLLNTENKSGKDYWKIVDAMPAEADQKYSYYAGKNFRETDVTAKYGFDAGRNDGIEKVTYVGTGSPQEVSIRTNGGTLNVGSSTVVSKGKVWHYGTLSKAVVYTEDNSFHTHGLIEDMDLKAGRVVADSNGMIALIKAAAGTKAEKENGGLIFIPEGTVIGEQGINWIQSGEEGDAKQLETLGYNVVAGKTEATAETKAANSYKIGTKDELIQFRKDWNEGKIIAVVPFTLTNDIDVSDYQWGPIGNWGYPFHGTFDGNGHKIIGLTATTGAGENGVYSTGDSTGYGELFGLFGVVGNGDATIKNLTITNVNVNLPSGKNVGAVIGYAPSNEDFKSGTKGDYYAPNKWTNNSSVGYGSISLSNVTVGSETDNSAIVANAHVGGMIGKTYADGSLIELSDCVNYASITSTVKGFNAGLVATLANNHELKLTNCVNNGNISVPSGTATETGNGGLVGRPNGNLTITLDSCINNGNITTINQCSGLINLGNGGCSSLIVKNCLNTGNITSLGCVANAIGSHSSLTLTNTYNTGVISADHANMAYGASDNNANLPDGFAKVVINKSSNLKSAIVVFEVAGEWINNTKVVAGYTVTRTGEPGNYSYSASKN